MVIEIGVQLFQNPSLQLRDNGVDGFCVFGLETHQMRRLFEMFLHIVQAMVVGLCTVGFVGTLFGHSEFTIQRRGTQLSHGCDVFCMEFRGTLIDVAVWTAEGLLVVVFSKLANNTFLLVKHKVLSVHNATKECVQKETLGLIAAGSFACHAGFGFMHP